MNSIYNCNDNASNLTSRLIWLNCFRFISVVKYEKTKSKCVNWTWFGLGTRLIGPCWRLTSHPIWMALFFQAVKLSWIVFDSFFYLNYFQNDELTFKSNNCSRAPSSSIPSHLSIFYFAVLIIIIAFMHNQTVPHHHLKRRFQLKWFSIGFLTPY